MNTAQIIGMRKFHAETNRVVKHTMSAKEMALTPHNLGRTGNYAITEDGHHWIWDERFGHWAMWK